MQDLGTAGIEAIPTVNSVGTVYAVRKSGLWGYSNRISLMTPKRSARGREFRRTDEFSPHVVSPFWVGITQGEEMKNVLIKISLGSYPYK